MLRYTQHDKKRLAFTLLELLLVIAIIAVLAGIIMFALKPADRLREANQTKYLSNANDLEKAFNSYVVDNGGNLPSAFNSLTYGYYDICRQGQSGSCVSLDELITNGKMSSIPVDNDNQTATTTGFKVRYDPVKKEAIVYSNAEYFSVSASGATLTSGLNGYWKLDDLSGPSIDSALDGNNGNWVGNTVAVTGKFGNATDFDGTGDYISIGTPSSLDLNMMTVSAWVKTSVGSVSFANSTIAGNYSQYFLSLGDYSTSTPRVTGYVRTNGLVWKYIKGNTSINDNQWHHVSMTYDGQYVKVYLDGVLDAAPLSVTELLSTAGTFLIGSYNPSNNTDASVDEVRVYNRALNSIEVLALYNYAPPPVAHWRFDEATGTSASDSSGNNYIGTLVNGPSWIPGRYGNGISFDGVDDYSTYGNILNFGTNSFTINSWYRLTQNTPDLNGLGFINKQVYDPNIALRTGWSMILQDGSYNNLAMIGADGTNAFKNDAHGWRVNTGNNLNDGNWHYISYTLDKQNDLLKVYYDGIFLSSTAWGMGSVSNTDIFEIGRGPWGFGGTYYKGSIDDVKIYNYARTQEQIMKDMNNL